MNVDISKGKKKHVALGAIFVILAILTGCMTVGLGLGSVVPPHRISLVGASAIALTFVLTSFGAAAALKDRSLILNIGLYCLTIGGLLAFSRILRAIFAGIEPFNSFAGVVATVALGLCVGSALSLGVDLIMQSVPEGVAIREPKFSQKMAHEIVVSKFVPLFLFLAISVSDPKQWDGLLPT
jgi:hypothetical protein